PRGGSVHGVRSCAAFASLRLASSCPMVATIPPGDGCATNGGWSGASGESGALSANANSKSCRSKESMWPSTCSAPSALPGSFSAHECRSRGQVLALGARLTRFERDRGAMSEDENRAVPPMQWWIPRHRRENGHRGPTSMRHHRENGAHGPTSVRQPAGRRLSESD